VVGCQLSAIGFMSGVAVGVSCWVRVTVVELWLLIVPVAVGDCLFLVVGCLLSRQELAVVLGSRLSVVATNVGYRLSVSPVAHFFHCRCPALLS
jgi:hypothetical protein